ncbi:MAG TPA: glycosyltransferase [Bryobacteraceae bacterium]|jgi:1,2-diacylglycerol 3-beta-galactosyltransferase
MVTKIDFLFFDAGGGHRSAATALKSVIDGQNRPWDVRMVNLQEILDSMDVFRKVTGLRLEDIYNKMLAKGWTLGAAEGLKFMHGVLRVYHRPMVRLLHQHWERTRPDMVVSLIPNFNRAIYQSLRAAFPATPFATILTDFADYPPHFWIEPFQTDGPFLICGSSRAVQQASTLGYPSDRIKPVSGMILRPKFYEPVTVDRAVERVRLGLDPKRPTGLVLFGGQGSSVMLEIARRLPETQLILICGRNQKLAAALRDLPSSAPRFIEGFTSEIPYYMHLSDFFIGKPGPGSISEAVAMKLPVILERNAWTLPQERYNVEWVRERNAGLVLDNFRGIDAAVKRLLSGLDAFRASVDQIQNRAVFEIPEILNGILEPSGIE